MAFIDLSRSEEIKVEAYCAALLVLLAVAFSPPFWVEAVLAILLSSIVARLVLALSEAIEMRRAAGGVMAASAVTMLLFVMWGSTRSAADLSGGGGGGGRGGKGRGAR